MGVYILKRVLYSLLVLIGAVSVVFVILRIVPGDPALAILGPDATSAELDALREQLGLSRPLLEQYVSYLLDAAHLDFGPSLRLGGDAMHQVLARMPMTAALAVTAVLFAVIPGIALGTLAALKPGTVIDRAVSVASLIAQSMPSFWIGLVFILVFARGLGILPSVGAGSPAHILLPTITLSLPFAAMVMRLTRSGLLEVVGEDYIRTARSKGLREHVVLFPHAFRNALIPIVTVIGVYFGTVLGGSVVVEKVFAWPGVGRLIVDSIGFRDYGVVQAGALLFAAIVVTVNLVVDVLYGYLDPRVRLAQ